MHGHRYPYKCVEFYGYLMKTVDIEPPCIIGGWAVTPTGKSFRFVRACARSGCQVEFELKSGTRPFPFPFCHAELSLFPCAARRCPFSPCEIEVRSKWNRSEIEVKSKWNRSELEVKSKWNQIEIKVKSKWNRSEIEVESKWNRSEIEVKSKWAPSLPPNLLSKFSWPIGNKYEV